MNRSERVKKFVEELSQLTEKYGLKIETEGAVPFLYDLKEKDYANYIIYCGNGYRELKE